MELSYIEKDRCNIASAYKEVETAFAKILEVFACYDIMSVYIDKAQLKAENKRYCKMMLTKWKKFKEQCIKLIEEDEYNPFPSPFRVSFLLIILKKFLKM